MINVVKVPKRLAEKVKQYLIEENILSQEYKIAKDDQFLFFPITSEKSLKSKFKTLELVDKKLEAKTKLTSFKDAISSKITKDKLKYLKTAYDLVGTIAILEIEPELEKKQNLIAETLLKTNPAVKTVLKKSGIHEGEFRTQRLKYLAGKRTKTAFYKENNVALKFDVEKVYFSVRLSTERKRIYQLVKPGEHILVMFSGCGVYPLVISKNSHADSVIGIEVNPEGHKYAEQNKTLNNITNVTFYLGDVLKVIPKLKQQFDRILMPLPKSAEDFLPSALSVSKKGTIFHFYDFLDESNFDDAESKVKSALKKTKFKYKKLSLVKCGQFSPHVYRICLDFQVL